MSDTNPSDPNQGNGSDSGNSGNGSAIITSPENVTQGSTGNTATITEPKDGDTYEWTITNGAGETVASGTGPGIEIPTDATGNLTVTVTVSSDDGTTSDSVTVIVKPGTGNGTITVPENVTQGSTGNTATITEPKDGDTYEWTITNGAGDTVASGTGPSIEIPTDATGDLTVSITVTHDDGSTTNDAVAVTVEPGTGNGIITTPDSVTQGSSGNTATITDPKDGESYEWTITNSDGETVASGTGPSIEIPTDSTGDLTVSVTVTHDDGSTSSDTVTVTVESGTGGLGNGIITVPENVTQGSGENTATITNPQDGDSYEWTITNSDGETVASGSGTGIEIPTDATGNLTVTVTITHGDGSTSTYSVTVIVRSGNDLNFKITGGRQKEKTVTGCLGCSATDASFMLGWLGLALLPGMRRRKKV
ncbi:MAG: hypothetical protein LBM75_05710 [Myxococcales bacterium]|nr:hypothetical protein [Myxococcales bacterium]